MKDQIKTGDQAYDFNIYDISIIVHNISDTFANGSNIRDYMTVLREMKNNGNDDYKLFLNKHGWKDFCKFKVEAPDEVMKKKGIYCYFVDGDVRYIGSTTTSFRQRFYSAGYANINARACLKNGQSTNCHINSKVNELSSGKGLSARVKVGFYVCDNNFSNDDILNLETKMIQAVSDHCKKMDKDILWNVKDVTAILVGTNRGCTYNNYAINILDSGSIEVRLDGETLGNSKAALRDIASVIDFEYESSWNTRQLGAKVINEILKIDKG